MTSSYRKIQGPRGHLAKREPFTGNTMSAVRGHGEDYLVSSYETVIAWCDGVTGEVTIQDKFYSPTTTRHQNLCRAWL
jgi:hypothetical protein